MGFAGGDGVKKTERVSQVVMESRRQSGFTGGDGVETEQVSQVVMESRWSGFRRW